MPYKIKKKTRTRRRRRAAGLATKPAMMGKTLATKRYHGVDTRTFYFKMNGQLVTSPAPTQFFQWKSDRLLTAPLPSWLSLCALYDQYKILGFTVRYYPANVGIESHSESIPGIPDLTLKRGNQCMWIDQRFDPNQPVPTAIGDVINTASAKLFNPRRPYRRSLWRPKGVFSWGSCKDVLAPPLEPTYDPWIGTINHLVVGLTQTPLVNAQPYYFYTLQYKVVFRGRTQD